jgi:hypothetical protein
VKLRRRAGIRAVPAAAVALLLLTGCGGDMTPGTAAVVNGSRITDDEVKALADAQCTAADVAAEAGNATTAAVSRVKRQSLGLLMDIELSEQYAEAEGIEPQKTLADGFYNQLEPGITPLPGKARTVLADVFQAWAEGRAILVQAGSRSTGEEIGFTNVEQLLNAGLQDRETWLKKADIETNPRYGPNENGFPGGGDSSVSRARSDFAKGAGGTGEPDPEWVSGLPSGQKCG